MIPLEEAIHVAPTDQPLSESSQEEQRIRARLERRGPWEILSECFFRLV